MTTRNRNQDVSPVGSGHERITRRSQVSVAEIPSMTDQEMAARMVSICATDIWNLNPTALRPGPLF